MSKYKVKGIDFWHLRWDILLSMDGDFPLSVRIYDLSAYSDTVFHTRNYQQLYDAVGSNWKEIMTSNATWVNGWYCVNGERVRKSTLSNADVGKGG